MFMEVQIAGIKGKDKASHRSARTIEGRKKRLVRIVIRKSKVARRTSVPDRVRIVLSSTAHRLSRCHQGVDPFAILHLDILEAHGSQAFDGGRQIHDMQ